MRAFSFVLLPLLLACTAADDAGVAQNANAAQPQPERSTDARPFEIEPLAQFNEPWAMTFLDPGNAGGWILVTEKPGRLRLWNSLGQTLEVSGVPAVDYGGQGGLGDVVLHPDFARNNLVYLSFAEAGPDDTRGAAVGRGRLVIDEMDDGSAELRDFRIIWRQSPKVSGRGHYGHRLAFGPDGKLYITNGDRQKFDPAQDMSGTLGKIVRLNDDGSVPADNPWASRGGVTAQLWTTGHRNPLGIAFAADGRLWAHEMGPEGGDEFNLIERGANYGYPIVSNGSHYGGRDIPDHPTRPEFAAPKIFWNPSISPAGLIVYSGRLFPDWRGDAIMGALSGQALVRIDLDGGNAREAGRWPMDARIREVEQGPDGAIYLLEDMRDGRGGRLLRLTPAR